MTDDDLLATRLTTMLAERAEDITARPGHGTTLGRDVVRRGHAVRRRRRMVTGSALAAAAVVLGTGVILRPGLPLHRSDSATPATTSTSAAVFAPKPGPLHAEPPATRVRGLIQFDRAPVLDPAWPVTRLLTSLRTASGWVVQVQLRDGGLGVAEVRDDGSVGLVSFPKDSLRGLAISPDGTHYLTADRVAGDPRLRVTVTPVGGGADVQEHRLSGVDGDPVGAVYGWTSKGVVLMTEPASGSGRNHWQLWDPSTGVVTELPPYSTVFTVPRDPGRLVIESDGCWRTLALDKADLSAGVNAGDPDRGALGPLVQCAATNPGSGAISVSPAGTSLLRGGLVSALDGSGAVPLQVPGPLGVLGWEDEHTVVVFTMSVTTQTGTDGRTTTTYGDATGAALRRCDVRSGACIAVDTRGNTGWLP